MPRNRTKGTKKENTPKRRGKVFSKSEKEQSTNFLYRLSSEEIDRLKSILKEDDWVSVPTLIAAVILNKYELVKQLVNEGCNVNAFGRNPTCTPLMWAVKLKHVEIANFLLENGAKNNNGCGILLMAVENKWDEPDLTKLWNDIKHTLGSADFTGNDCNRLLHRAVENNWNGFVNILISEKVNVNVLASHMVTPLMVASFSNNLSIVSALLEADADVLQTDEYQNTALSHAVAAAIIRSIEKPHLVIEKLLSAFEVRGITFQTFLESMVDAFLSRPFKLQKSGGTCRDIRGFIIPYTMRYRTLGIRSLLGAHIFKRVAQATERNMSSVQHLTSCLVVMNSLLDTRNELDSTLESFIADGCATICLAILKKYGTSCDIDCSLALKPLIKLSLGHASGRTWLRKHCEEITLAHQQMKIKYSNCNANTDDAKDFLKFTELFNAIKEEKSLQLRNAGEFQTNAGQFEPESLKNKSREVATAANRSTGSAGDQSQNGKKFLDYKSASDTSILKASQNSTETDEEKPRWSELSTWEDVWLMDSGKDPLITKYHETLALLEHKVTEDINHSMQSDTSSHEEGKLVNILGTANSPQNAEVQFQSAITYLSGLLNKILQKFQCHWGQDASRARDDTKDEGSYNSEAMKKLELVHVERLRAEFEDLVVQLNHSAPDHLFECTKLMTEVENLLLNFKVRGKSMIDDTLQIASTQEKDVGEKMPMQLNGDSYSKDDCQEPAPPEYTVPDEHPDALYLREMLALPPRKPINSSKVAIDREKTMKHAYHLCNSIEALVDDYTDLEDNISNGHSKYTKRLPIEEQVFSVGKRGGEMKTPPKIEFDPGYEFMPSRWCNVIKSLQLLKNYNVLLNGDIRVSGEEVHDVHIISAGGSFSPVVLGLDSKDRPLAVKRIKARDDVSKLMKDLINPLLGLRNANLLHYFTCHLECNELIVATPLCEYNMGEYIMCIKQHGNMHLRAFDVAKQFLSGLRFLHDRKEPIVHGNLKPSNIFLDLSGNVRIAEFGIHKVGDLLNNHIYNLTDRLQALYTFTEAPNTSLIWFARETLNNFRETATVICTRASDVQVAGMIVHFIFSAGKHPFGETMDEILRNLEDALPRILTNNIDLQDLISWMLLYDPGDRPSINQVLNHVFFWSQDRRWRFILACAGLSTYGTPLNISVKELFLYIKMVAVRQNIKGKWIAMTKQRFPNYNYSDEDEDSVAGLLAFVRACVQNGMAYCVVGAHDLHNYILETFPVLPLSLYRILESSQWLTHNVLKPFTAADSVSA
ncbi:uncharacterized protein LOC116175370 isoform X1 [Photinus pyralis]|uniref:uncharacterized protein LOC116175370 isoform X1 n=1 Tax=Photinus pyralis TaxID=7054 RepID=UPI0012670ADB|nr:uncharacterized protein LOC116175370 isoform X1 [Photinus pyralis]